MFVILGMPSYLTTFIWTIFLVYIQISRMFIIFKVSLVGVMRFLFFQLQFAFYQNCCIPKNVHICRETFNLFIQPWSCREAGILWQARRRRIAGTRGYSRLHSHPRHTGLAITRHRSEHAIISVYSRIVPLLLRCSEQAISGDTLRLG